MYATQQRQARRTEMETEIEQVRANSVGYDLGKHNILWNVSQRGFVCPCAQLTLARDAAKSEAAEKSEQVRQLQVSVCVLRGCKSREQFVCTL